MKEDTLYGLRLMRVYLLAEKCLSCGSIIGYGGLSLCPDCRKRLIDTSAQTRTANGCSLLVAYEYTDELRAVVHSLKYRKNRESGLFLAREMTKLCETRGQADADLVVGVPKYKGRRGGGFCQAEYLAKCIARMLNTKYADDLLYKRKNIKSQTFCKTREERRQNVVDIYRARKGADLNGKKILLIDDVTTTGATMGECASALIKTGAAEVVCVAAAKPLNPEKGLPIITLGEGYYEFSKDIDGRISKEQDD